MTRPMDGFVFDLDGTVYLGEAALPGAVEGGGQALTPYDASGIRTIGVASRALHDGG